MSGRALTPLLGTVWLLAIVVGLGLTLAMTIPGGNISKTPQQVVLSVDVNPNTDRIVLRHNGGNRIDLRTATLRIEVDGSALDHQPPVPFFSATGFNSGPTGPFNPAADPVWTTGEQASLQVAGTNRPRIEPGATVSVTLYQSKQPITTVRTTA